MSLTGEKKLDVEWVALIMNAKKIGLTPDEVMKFFKGAKSLESDSK